MRILIVRLSALGDIVMAGGLPGALRARYPAAHIAWLVQEGFEALPAANPALDEVLVWPRRQLAGAVAGTSLRRLAGRGAALRGRAAGAAFRSGHRRPGPAQERAVGARCAAPGSGWAWTRPRAAACC